MRELTPEEAQAAHMKKRRGRVAEIVGPTVQEKERIETQRRAVADAVVNMCRSKRNFLGTQPGSVARSEPSDVQSPQNEAEPTQRTSLPDGWRDGHWKTLQAMAAEFCNVETGNKAESIAVLEAYERGE